MRHEFHQARVDEDARADGIEDAIHDHHRRAARRQRHLHAETDGDGDGRGEAICDPQRPGKPFLLLWPVGRCQAGSETEAFEGLVECEDDVEDVEVGAGDCKRETDEDGVEDDAEFEDEYGCHLGSKVVRIS